MKNQLIGLIEKLRQNAHDAGTFDPGKPGDYPDFRRLNKVKGFEENELRQDANG